MGELYVSVPRAAVAAVLSECAHGPNVLRGCHTCYRRATARAQLRAYLAQTPPNANE